ncbi:dolichyl-diphosphooligosaccharide--protein glycosyltransferase subunit DAD1 [Anolis carolinensis]|uniref:Dolichyl-diphosphooligosaccharide--protein glycosyltransferase subunit DAD1 n=1 Tax=Anolis carolinensis TaxID=28377 RepID=A0A803TN81_ANOCA|nr:PREDICTED: dolichyl-diphosphooligosaccharide--protein glycosyltransferase subunit DAD1 [Anolis carolinensis]|eukprot:XP_003229600.2 PREDICTED: dolichyl-diphosphooligosaccharide--protein glycosyltransferase subunit DAD1 [Anolis carolinensis]
MLILRMRRRSGPAFCARALPRMSRKGFSSASGHPGGQALRRKPGDNSSVAMSGAASASSASGANSVGSVVRRFLAEYSSGTPSRLKVLDAYLLYVMLTGALQFGYCLGVGTFPFNSFLSGFISAVGSFILGVCLRIQINPQNKTEFQGISPERAFADFLFASTILHLVVINFVG